MIHLILDVSGITFRAVSRRFLLPQYDDRATDVVCHAMPCHATPSAIPAGPIGHWAGTPRRLLTQVFAVAAVRPGW
jgi:hypothetical protein